MLAVMTLIAHGLECRHVYTAAYVGVHDADILVYKHVHVRRHALTRTVVHAKANKRARTRFCIPTYLRTCPRACICAQQHTCLRTCLHTYVSAHTSAHACAHMSAYMPAYMCMHITVHMLKHMPMHMPVHMSVYACTIMHVMGARCVSGCTEICTCINAYIAYPYASTLDYKRMGTVHVDMYTGVCTPKVGQHRGALQHDHDPAPNKGPGKRQGFTNRCVPAT